MIDLNALRLDLNNQLKKGKVDPFYMEHKLYVLFYAVDYCEKHLSGKTRYDLGINITENGNLVIEVLTKRKVLTPIEITKRKLTKIAKACELPD
jgi:hypothetical protein